MILRRKLRRRSKRDEGSQVPATRRSYQALRAVCRLRGRRPVKSDRRGAQGEALEVTKPASTRTRINRATSVAHSTERSDNRPVQGVPRKVHLTRYRVNASGGTTDASLRTGSDDGNKFSSATVEVPTEIITRGGLRKMLGKATQERASNETFDQTEHANEEKKEDRSPQHGGKDETETSRKHGDLITRRVTRSMDEKPEDLEEKSEGKENKELLFSEEKKVPQDRRNDANQMSMGKNCEGPGIGNSDHGMTSANVEKQVNAMEKIGDQAVVDVGRVTQTRGRDRKAFRREDTVKMESEESVYLKGRSQSCEGSQGVFLTSSGPVTRARQVMQKGVEMGADLNVAEVIVDPDRRRKAVMAHKAMQEVMAKNQANQQQNVGLNSVKPLHNMIETRKLRFTKGSDDRWQLRRNVRWVRNQTQEKDVDHAHHINGKQNADIINLGKVPRDQNHVELAKHEQQQQKRRRLSTENLDGVGKKSAIMEVELAGPITRGMKRRVNLQDRGWNKRKRQMHEKSDNTKGAVNGVDGKHVSIVPLTDTGQEHTVNMVMEKIDNSTVRKLRSMDNIDVPDELKAIDQPELLLRDNAPMISGLKRTRDTMTLKEDMLLDDRKATFFRGSALDEEGSLRDGLDSSRNASFDTGEERHAGMRYKVSFDGSGHESKRLKNTSRLHEGGEYVDGKALKGESVSDTLEKDSVIRVELKLLEPETIHTKVVKRGGVVTTRAAENSSKGALTVLTNCVSHKLDDATGHGSGVMHGDTQKSCDNLLEFPGDTYRSARVYSNCDFSAKELERQAHETLGHGKCTSSSLKLIESEMPPVFSVRKEDYQEVALGEAPTAEKQNDLQATFREDHTSLESPIDDGSICVSSPKRKMARVMNGMLRDSELGNRFTHNDPLVDDGICRVDSKRKYYWVAANPKETGGRQMRPRPLDIDQPLPVLVEGFDQEYFTYDGGLFHRMLQEQEADWMKKNIEKVSSSRDAVQAIVIPSFQVLPEFQGQKKTEPEYVLPQSYIKYAEVAAEVYKAEYDRDDEDEEWLQHLNRTKMDCGLSSMISDDQFEKIIDFFENKYAQLVGQQSTHSVSSLERMVKDGSEKLYQNENPYDESVSGKLHGGSEECCICNGGENSVFNPVFKCSGCNIYVHQSCYGIQEPVAGYESGVDFRNNWYCRKCEAVAEGRTDMEFRCALCHKKGGALKPGVNPSKWVHVVCALYTNETFFVNPDAMEPVDGVTAAEARAKKQRRRCWFCGVGEGCRERCSVRGCNAIFHVSCGVNQGALFELKQSNRQVVGVRCLCATHANVALASSSVKDATFTAKEEPEDRHDLARVKRRRQSSWLRRKQRDPLLQLKNGGQNSALREVNINHEVNISERSQEGGLECPARQQDGGKSPSFEELCKSRGLDNNPIEEEDVGVLLSLEEALKTDIALSDDLEHVYAYWLLKRAKSNGPLLLRLQQEKAAETYGIFNKDESEGGPPVPYCKPDPSRDGMLDLETEHVHQQWAVVKQQLERLQEITKLVIQRERIKFEIYSIEQEIGKLKLETLGAKSHCSWCERTQHLLTCTICNSSFCFQCFRSRKGYGVRGWAVALKHHKFICGDCQNGEVEEGNIHVSEVSFLKDKDCVDCELGLGAQMRVEEHGAVSCHNNFASVCTRRDYFGGEVREDASSGYN